MPTLTFRFRYVEGLPERQVFDQSVDISDDLLLAVIRKEQIFQDATLDDVVYVQQGPIVWENGVPVVELVPRSRAN